MHSAWHRRSLAPNRDQHKRVPGLDGARLRRCHRGSRLCLVQQCPFNVQKRLEIWCDMRSLSVELPFRTSQASPASFGATQQSDADVLHPQAWPVCVLWFHSEVSFGCRARPTTPVPFLITSLPSKAKPFLFPSQRCDFLHLLALLLPYSGNAGPCYRQAQVSPRAGSQLLASAAGSGTLRHVCTAGLLLLPYISPDGCLDRKGTASEAACFETGNIIHASSLSWATSNASILHPLFSSHLPCTPAASVTASFQPLVPPQLCLPS